MSDSPERPGADGADSVPTSSRRFATTRWSVVLQAGRDSSPPARTALETLCESYWYPLYVFARRWGQDPEAACDSTQAFFARFLEKDYLGDVDRNRGRFRSFLLASFKNHLNNEHHYANAKKRGGGIQKLSLDVDSAEQRYALEPSHAVTPERVFERRWALTVLESVLQKLEAHYRDSGKEELFAALKGTLVGGRDDSYRELGEKLDMTEGAIKVAVHRLRSRYRDTLRAEIADTVSNDEEIDEEMRYLLAALQV
ncbi:MAG: sigma-70 family RNA polymerase sigma factor [Planctomycetota bacterium]